MLGAKTVTLSHENFTIKTSDFVDVKPQNKEE